jgi:hypothetical protein
MVVLLPLLLLSWESQVLLGQVASLPTRVGPRITPPLSVPFGPGERLEYDVKVGLARGSGYMEVLPLDEVRGKRTYHVAMAVKGGLIWDQVNDHYESWFDVENLVTLRSIEDVNQLGRQRYKHFEFYPEERRWVRQDEPNSGVMPTSLPLDQISFFYFARSLPLEVGDQYTFNRYYRDRGNPVVLRVLRRDTVEVPAGTFPAIVVQPVIKSSGFFGDGGEAELYFTDDDRKLLVYMETRVPPFFTLSLHLKTITEGHPLVAPGTVNAEEIRSRLALPEPEPLTADPGSGSAAGAGGTNSGGNGGGSGGTTGGHPADPGSVHLPEP